LVKEPLLSLAPSDLRALAAAISSGRLAAPFSTLSVERYITVAFAQSITESLQTFVACGISPQGLGRALELLADSMAERFSIEELVDLVTTGPDDGAAARDTSVVVRDLFHNAGESVLVVGYAVRQGQQVFQALSDRMTELPTLKVRMCLDIRRDAGDTSAPSEIVRRFLNHFRRLNWPRDKRLPEIFYDPRSLEYGARDRASLHAKCIVVDEGDLFVSSANFTEAGQGKNLEVGLRLRSAVLARRLVRFIDTLIGAGRIKCAS
jgi:phosphatidylserine/phosphatidylglycerophosphate/cardiolipin synthase-like enzyme